MRLHGTGRPVQFTACKIATRLLATGVSTCCTVGAYCVRAEQLCALLGDAELPGLTDEEKPRMRGPKRASKIRKLFNLSKDDDVRKYVNTYRRKIVKGDKTHSKAPKIQRLVTPLTLQRKRRRRAIKRERINKVRTSQDTRS